MKTPNTRPKKYAKIMSDLLDTMSVFTLSYPESIARSRLIGLIKELTGEKRNEKYLDKLISKLLDYDIIITERVMNRGQQLVTYYQLNPEFLTLK